MLRKSTKTTDNKQLIFQINENNIFTRKNECEIKTLVLGIFLVKPRCIQNDKIKVKIYINHVCHGKMRWLGLMRFINLFFHFLLLERSNVLVWVTLLGLEVAIIFRGPRKVPCGNSRLILFLVKSSVKQHNHY